MLNLGAFVFFLDEPGLWTRDGWCNDMNACPILSFLLSSRFYRVVIVKVYTLSLYIEWNEWLLIGPADFLGLVL